MRQDSRLAFRRLLHDPGFSVTVILILALIIGANIAVLSVVNTALVRPMPYPQPQRLAELVVTAPGVTEPDDSHDGETWESVRDLTSVAVTGVMPAGFQANDPADLWTPLRPSRTGEGAGENYGILLRLKPGVTMGQASAEMAPLTGRLDLPGRSVPA
jgi:hypothetical protein